MPILAVQHLTTYRYRRQVSFGEHRMMFRPRDSHDQRLLDHTLLVEPEPCALRHVFDAFGNCVTIAGFDRRADTLRFLTTLLVDHRAVGHASLPALTGPGYGEDERIDLAGFLAPGFDDRNGKVRDWAEALGRASPDAGPSASFDAMRAITHAIHQRFRYAGRRAAGAPPPAPPLSRGAGCCRDFAVLMIDAARRLGLAARFVSGYVLAGGGNPQHSGGGSTHAWAQVFLPGGGWIDFDPTNGIVGSRDLLRVAVTRAARQAVPLAGTYLGDPFDCLGMDVSVQVTQASPSRLPEGAFIAGQTSTPGECRAC